MSGDSITTANNDLVYLLEAENRSLEYINVPSCRLNANNAPYNVHAMNIELPLPLFRSHAVVIAPQIHSPSYKPYTFAPYSDNRFAGRCCLRRACIRLERLSHPCIRSMAISKVVRARSKAGCVHCRVSHLDFCRTLAGRLKLRS